MPKGSVLLWVGGTLHGQSAQLVTNNREHEGIRRGLLFIYNVGWARPEHNFHWAMPPEVLIKLSPKLQELMGRVGANRVEHPWYTGPVYAQPLLYSSTEAADDDEEFNERQTSMNE